MRTVSVFSSRGAYPAMIGAGLLGGLGAILEDRRCGRPWAMVTNTTVGPLVASRVAAALGADPPLELPDGEVHKRWPQVETVCGRWLDQGVHRGSTAVAVGGGVVTDLVGFAAALYQRGIDWVAVPTTVLALVDAAVGGKTGVNLDQGKNLVGVFWPPRAVVADVDTLATLPERELRAGLAEVVKAGWIGDHGLLDLVRRQAGSWTGQTSEWWVEIVARAVAVKASVVETDEREAGARQALNLGHTLGHGLEAATGYRRFLHGEAVAWGMLAAAELAHRRGLLSTEGRTRMEEAVGGLGPRPEIADVSVDAVLGHIGHDKKRDASGVAWVLPVDDGVRLDQRVEADEVRAVLQSLSPSSG